MMVQCTHNVYCNVSTNGVQRTWNDPEKNRMKVTKFRTRKGLKEAGYGDDEIKAFSRVLPGQM